jgi:hypothetical protein
MLYSRSIALLAECTRNPFKRYCRKNETPNWSVLKKNMCMYTALSNNQITKDDLDECIFFEGVG